MSTTICADMAGVGDYLDMMSTDLATLVAYGTPTPGPMVVRFLTKAVDKIEALKGIVTEFRSHNLRTRQDGDPEELITLLNERWTEWKAWGTWWKSEAW